MCSNGAVTARLDADEPAGFAIVDTVTFDPGPALRAIAMELPDALYAVEDLGVGFRVSDLFPTGELSGEMDVVGFDELAATPATRVVIRAPARAPTSSTRSSSASGCTRSSTRSAGPRGWT